MLIRHSRYDTTFSLFLPSNSHHANLLSARCASFAYSCQTQQQLCYHKINRLGYNSATMASAAPSSTSTQTSKQPASHNTTATLQDRTNALYHNFLRVICAVRDTIDGLRPYTEAAIKAAYTAWIAKLAGLPPPCKEHDGKRMAQLLKCSHCSPWAQALQQIVSDAGENPKKKNWTVSNTK